MQTKLSNSTFVVVVTFNPETGLLEKNLKALAKQFKTILIVDNGSKNVENIEALAHRVDKTIKVNKLPSNTGIAHAQNVGLETAKAEGFEWLLTMDQDSVIPDNLSEEYKKIIESYDKIGLIAWDQRQANPETEVIKDDWWIVSSGCLTRVSVLDGVGGFDDDLFIDHVDTDVNAKIRNLGLRTLVTNQVKLHHQLGTQTGQKTVRGDFYHAHSPVRVYYIIRNGIVIFKRYFFKQPVWMLQALKTCFREGIYLLSFQPNKGRNLLLILRAWFDGVFNRLGKLDR